MYREQYLHSNPSIEKAMRYEQKVFHKKNMHQVKSPMQDMMSDWSTKRYNSVSRMIRNSAKKELLEEGKLQFSFFLF